MSRKALALSFAIPVALLAIFWLTVELYQEYWLRAAEQKVISAANALADGKEAPGVDFAEFVKPSDLASAFRSGFRVSGFDNIGLGFRAYDVKLRVSNGDQYNFDAYYLNGEWQLSCCTKWSSSELR